METVLFEVPRTHIFVDNLTEQPGAEPSKSGAYEKMDPYEKP